MSDNAFYALDTMGFMYLFTLCFAFCFSFFVSGFLVISFGA